MIKLGRWALRCKVGKYTIKLMPYWWWRPTKLASYFGNTLYRRWLCVQIERTLTPEEEHSGID